MSAGNTWARRFATGLSSLRDRAAARLASSSINPSRVWAHEWEPVDMECETVDARTGEVLSRSVRHAKICGICGATNVIGYLPCIDGKYFD
jgi:hypothetical protein